MFVTLGVCGVVFPMLPSARGEADNYSVGSVVMCVVCLAVGGFFLAKTRRAD